MVNPLLAFFFAAKCNLKTSAEVRKDYKYAHCKPQVPSPCPSKLLPQHHVVPDHWDKSKTADDSRLCSLCSDLDECERLWEWEAFSLSAAL